jgi:hypothetical protein
MKTLDVTPSTPARMTKKLTKETVFHHISDLDISSLYPSVYDVVTDEA